MSDFKDPTWFGIDAFFNWLKDHRYNHEFGTWDNALTYDDTYDYWKQLMDYVSNSSNYVKLVMGDEEYNRMKFLLSDTPVAGALIRLSDNIQYWSDYMKNAGIDWSQVLYPSRMSGSGAGVYGSMNFISSNITRLYG